MYSLDTLRVDNLGEKSGLKIKLNMRKVFIDGGTNLCQGLSQIMKIHNMDESWIIYSFEVNPNTRLLKVNHNESELRENIELRNIKINNWN